MINTNRERKTVLTEIRLCDRWTTKARNRPKKARRGLNDRYATTSAALKLLLLRLTGRGPGRCVALDAGTTTADAPVVIQASEEGFDFVPAAISARVLVALFRFAKVGSLDGVGDGGG